MNSANANPRQDDRLVRLKAPDSFIGDRAYSDRFGHAQLSPERTVDVSEPYAAELEDVGWWRIGPSPLRKNSLPYERQRDLAQYSRWRELQNQCWQPPVSLEAALLKIERRPAISFNEAVDLMAFGDDAVPADLVDAAAKLCQAARMLRLATIQDNDKDAVRCFRRAAKPGEPDNPIPRNYFENSLGIDGVNEADFKVALQSGRPQWATIMIETPTLVSALRTFVATEYFIAPEMIEPMTRPGEAGYVPFCSVLHWKMTDKGKTSRKLDDTEAWDNAVAQLLPLLETDIEVTGRPAGCDFRERIPGHIFSGIQIICPKPRGSQTIRDGDPWISCVPYEKPVQNPPAARSQPPEVPSWSGDLNDSLIPRRSGTTAGWTCLLMSKRDVLRHSSSLIEIEPETEIETGGFAAKPGAVSKAAGPSAAGKLEQKRSWILYDEPHFQSMKSLLDRGAALSIPRAARKVEETSEVSKTGSVESRIKRLERGYRKWVKSLSPLPTTPE